jgi:photosystem II stability/assembly factor-like uncharacterized protein
MRFYVTNAVQLKYCTHSFNEKIGILKDSAGNVSQTSYNSDTRSLNIDSLQIPTSEFIRNINPTDVISVGSLSSLYTDFQSCVSTYFGDPNGFASMYALVQEFKVNNGVFDASAFLQVINKSTFNMAGSYISDLSGVIKLTGITTDLAYSIETNVFNNRTGFSYPQDIAKGFMTKDLVFVPEGFTITLSLDIQPEIYGPINNIGPQNLNVINNLINFTNGFYKRVTTSSTTNITQKTTIPILFVLSDCNYELNSISSNIQSITTINDPSGNPISNINGKFIGASCSETGLYQALVSSNGNIYISNSAGQSWVIPDNIGPSDVNAIGMSYDGQYMLASNGFQIFNSSDYGQTWRPTYNTGTSTIYVSISLQGQYQFVVSSGDTLYRSSDYGASWQLLDISRYIDLYNSIEAYTPVNIACSFNGQYVTICIDLIYTSSDYGVTWRNASLTNNLEDQNFFSNYNFYGIAMSSDGQYQTTVGLDGPVITSSDYGVTWTINPYFAPKDWKTVGMSATGEYQAIAEVLGEIYYSIDYGITWSVINKPSAMNKSWNTVFISSDGKLLIATDIDGIIYQSKVN